MNPGGLARRPAAVIAALLALLTIAAFSGLFSCGFINYDDPEYVTKNDHVLSGLTPSTIVWSLTSTQSANWHPLTWLSHALDRTLFGLNPAYHHAVNLFLHILSTLLLFLVLYRATRAAWQSGFAALVFAIHPLHVESVAWIAERKDVLSGVFWMLTIAAYLRFREVPGRGRFILTVGLFALGLTAKPMLVTLPFVLVLLDYWPLGRLSFVGPTSRTSSAPGLAESLREKAPLFLLSLVSAVITFVAQQQGGAMKVLSNLSLSERCSNALVSYLSYIGKTFYPVDLSVFYPYPSGGPEGWEVAGAIVVLAGISIGVWRMRTRYPFLAVGWLWYLGTLVPVIGIVQAGRQAMADRYMYIPMIGLLIMIAWGAPILLRSFRQRRIMLGAAAALVGLCMIAAGRTQVSYWSNSRSLFEHALAVTSDNYIAHNNLAVVLADSGRHADALAHLQKALAIAPDFMEAHHNLARSLVAVGRYDEALQEYAWIEARIPPDPALHLLMADLLDSRGRLREAEAHLREALRLAPSDAGVRCKLADLLSRLGDYAAAQTECESVLKADPGNSGAHQILGVMAGEQRRYELAVKELGEAVRDDPNNDGAYNNFGILYDRMGKADEAMAMYEKAVQINPRNADACLNLGVAFAQKKQYAEAAEQWRNAIASNPALGNARLNLGKLYALEGKLDSAAGILDEALRLDPQNIQIQFQYADVLAQAGKTAAAESLYIDVLRKAPAFEAARRALEKMRGGK